MKWHTIYHWITREGIRVMSRTGMCECPIGVNHWAKEEDS